MVSEIERLILRIESYERLNKNLQEKVQFFEGVNNKLREKNNQLEEIIDELNKEIERLGKENLRLHRELRKYHNENTPSSSIPPYLKPVIEIEEHTEKEEKPKGKTANIRNSRPKRCEKTEELELVACPCCGGKVKKRKAKPRKRIILKLVIPKAEAVRYITPKYFCERCNKDFTPMIPETLPNSKFDLNVFLFISFLSVGLNISHDGISRLFSTMFGLNISSSSVSNILKRLKNYLGKSYAQLEYELRKEKVLYRDETGWRMNGRANWVWAISAAKRVFYKIEESRNSATAKKFKPAKDSITVCDGYAAYNEPERRIQRCWAHLLRKAKEPEWGFQSEKEAEEYVKLVRGLHQLFREAKEKRKEGCSEDLKKKYEERLLELLQMKGLIGKNRELLTNYIMKFYDEWFTFLEFLQVQPTNNEVERDLRHIVLKRKISQQSRSWEAQQSYAMQASLYMTAQKRKQDYLKVLRNAVEDKFNAVGKF